MYERVKEHIAKRELKAISKEDTKRIIEAAYEWLEARTAFTNSK